MDRYRWLRACLIIACLLPLTLPACQWPIPLPTATPMNCAWTWASGAVPPAVDGRAQEMFAATGVEGKLVTSGFGENNSCDGFGLMAVDFEFQLRAADLRDQPVLAAMAAKVEPIPKQATQGQTNVGNVRIRFDVADAFCWWEIATQQCGAIMTR
jgi:hypothetical protein